jgi:hypothetical protein
VKKIGLTRGKYATVSDKDYRWLARFSWTAQPTKTSWVARGVVDGVLVLMHRIILGAPRGVDVDHKDFNGLHNQRSNIRLATPVQNEMNKRKRSGTSSKYKGVSWQKSNRNWRVIINVNGSKVYLGSFRSERQAALAYDKAAKRNFGRFARTNF